jgi:rRNA-processing protein FCF1
MTRAWVPLGLLPLLAAPFILAPGDARAIPFGLCLYALAVIFWLLLFRIEPDTRRAVVLGAGAGAAFAFCLTPLVNAVSRSPSGIADSSAGRGIAIAFFYVTAIILGAAIALERVRRARAPESDAGRDARVAAAHLLKICDTSVLIDGRIAEMAEAGFVDGELVIPQFILRELQSIADSSDQLKRNRGRRGLDIVKRLQEVKDITVSIPSTDFADEREVDHKLIRLAGDLGAVLITNDFNLNKVARVRSIKVLNLNDLVNALKTIYLPGEIVVTQVTRSGKEPGQGIAYLDDGTMVVVDGGAGYVGRQIRVVVTNIHQTTAGRMIFSRFEEAVGRKGEGEEKTP